MVRNTLLALIVCLSGTLLTAVSANAQDSILERIQTEVASVADRTRMAVVSIEEERQPTPPQSAAGIDKERTRRAWSWPKSGSGFSIGNGYIVTTADVASDMKYPLVITDSGTRIRAIIIGIDIDSNIGLLRLASKTELPALQLGDSSTVLAGHFAISMGNQTGHANSVSLNIVSGVRNHGFSSFNHFYPALLQISGTVGVGTSGAPIFNSRGEVVGMIVAFIGENSMGFNPGFPQGFNPYPGPGAIRPEGASLIPGQIPATPSGTSPTEKTVDKSHDKAERPRDKQERPRDKQDMGFFAPPRPIVTSAGFALPINNMKLILTELREKRLIHSWIGVDLDEKRKTSENDGIVTTQHTIKVTAIYPESPAASAGLQQEDLLLSLNDMPIHRMIDVKSVITQLRPGDTLTIKITRGGSPMTLRTKITPRPELTKPPPGGSHKRPS